MSSKFFYDMGKAYDAALFITSCTREDDFLSNLRNRFGKSIDVNEAMRWLFSFKKRHKSFVLPSEIHPFIHTDYHAGRYSFLINAIRDNVNFEHCTKDGISAFLQDRNLKKLFWEHHFPQKKNNIAKQICSNDKTLYVPDAIDTLENVPENIKMRLVDMSHDFPKYQWKLVETFKEVYVLVDEYHSENQAIIDEIKNQITDTLIDRLHKIFKLPNSILSFPFYFSLLNGLQFDYRNRDGKVCVGLGQFFNSVIDSLYHYKHISFHSIGKVVHVETRAEMLDMFFKYKKLCASEIAHKLHISQSTIYLHLNAMLVEEMIRFTDPSPKNNGEKVYYSINPDYFQVFARYAVDANQQAHNNISKGIDRYELPRKKRKARDGLTYNDNDEYNEEEVE